MSEKALKRVAILISAIMFILLYTASDALPKTKLIPSVATAILGYLMFRFGSKFFGKRIGFMALLLFAFSPSILSVGNYFNSTLTMTALIMISAFVLLWLFNEPSVRKTIITGIFIGATSFFYASSNNFLAFLKTVAVNSPSSFFFNEPLALHAILLMIILLIFASLKQHYQLNGFSGFRIKNLADLFTPRAAGFVLFILAIVCWRSGKDTYIYILPILFLLIPYLIFNLLKQRPRFEVDFSFQTMKNLFAFYADQFKLYVLLALLILWYIISSIAQYPDFSSYANYLNNYLNL
ncbi:MAG: hypothetical protein AAB949_01535 [Patescibacteria group bacterium]